TACAPPTSCSTASGPTRPPPCAARRPSRWRPTSTSSTRRAACPTAWSARSSPATGRSERSGVDRGHVGVAVDRSDAERRDLVEAREVLVGHLDVERRDVLLEEAHVLRARDRSDVLALAQHPRERELTGRRALLGGDLAHAVDELEVALEVLALEARVVGAEVAGLEVVGRPEAAGEAAAAERAVGDEPDPELADRGEDLVLRVARPQRVLGLQRADRVDRVRATDRLRRGLRQPEVADLALLDELRHRADRLLDRHRLV